MIKTIALFLITVTSPTATADKQMSYDEVTVTAKYIPDAYLICKSLGEKWVDRKIDMKLSRAYVCESDVIVAGRLRYQLHEAEKKETK